MTTESLSGYNYLWDGTNPGWVLVRNLELPGGFCIYNKNSSEILLVESDELNEALCERLRQAGANVLDSIPAGDASVEHRE